MHVSRLVIQNFRGIVDLDVQLSPFTVLIGENNSGKSTLLDAIRICLDKVPARRGYIFAEHDFVYGTYVPILLRCTITIPDGDPNYAVYAAKLGKVIGITAGASDKTIVLEVKGTWNDLTGQSSHTPAFLNPAGQPYSAQIARDALNGMAEIISCKSLHANRSASHDFKPSAQFLAPILDASKIDADAAAAIVQDLDELSNRLVGTSDGLRLVKDELAGLAAMVDIDNSEDPASISPLPASLRGLLHRTEIRLKSSTGANLPLQYHGAGTQSLASFFLFSAFSKFIREKQHCFSVACVEEPEAHLHPWAISAFVKKVRTIADQVFVSTHSGDFAGAADIQSIRRLKNSLGSVKASHVDTSVLDDADLRKVKFHVFNQRGYLLFARYWILVEGETEIHLLSPLCEMLGISLGELGVYVVQYAQVDVRTLIKLADALGIGWHVIADGDAEGLKYADKTRTLLGKRNEADMLTTWTGDDIETLFWYSGFDSYYETTCPPSAKIGLPPTLSPDDRRKAIIKSALKSRSKPGAADDIFQLVQANGIATCPSEVTNCLARIAKILEKKGVTAS